MNLLGNKSRISITLDKNVDILVQEYSKRIHKSKSYVVNSVLANFLISQKACLVKHNLNNKKRGC